MICLVQRPRRQEGKEKQRESQFVIKKHGPRCERGPCRGGTEGFLTYRTTPVVYPFHPVPASSGVPHASPFTRRWRHSMNRHTISTILVTLAVILNAALVSSPGQALAAGKKGDPPIPAGRSLRISSPRPLRPAIGTAVARREAAQRPGRASRPSILGPASAWPSTTSTKTSWSPCPPSAFRG